MDRIAKAYAMSDAKISFVSLVNKAANKKQFLITKAEDGTASFQTYGKILKADEEAHYVTGIVYEPMVEDTQGNYMTEEEIQKAAYWFAKNGNKVDLQHSFEALEGAAVVESYIAKCDEEIEGQAVRKGTWVMTVEVNDPTIFEAIQKGELTGFSMGGVGNYSEEDVDISKSDQDPAEAAEKEGFLRKVAKWLGIEPIEKGEVKDTFNRRFISENFRNLWWSLSDALLDVWDPDKGQWGPETDMSKVQDALKDFTDVATEIFNHSGEESIFKCADGEDMAPIVKAGKAMSKKNVDTLKSIHETLGSFISNFEEKESEELDVSNEELKEVVKSAMSEALAQLKDQKPVEKQEEAPAESAPEMITKADVQAMIDEAIRKAMGEDDGDDEEEAPEDDFDGKVAKAVEKAIAPFLKEQGLPTNLNDQAGIEKSDDVHYLHGLI